MLVLQLRVNNCYIKEISCRILFFFNDENFLRCVDETNHYLELSVQWSNLVANIHSLIEYKMKMKDSCHLVRIYHECLHACDKSRAYKAISFQINRNIPKFLR